MFLRNAPRGNRSRNHCNDCSASCGSGQETSRVGECARYDTRKNSFYRSRKLRKSRLAPKKAWRFRLGKLPPAADANATGNARTSRGRALLDAFQWWGSVWPHDQYHALRRLRLVPCSLIRFRSRYVDALSRYSGEQTFWI